MIAHTCLFVSDYAKSLEFYLKALAPLDYTNTQEYGMAAGFFDGHDTDFWIKEEKTVIPVHLAFSAKSVKEVNDFYKAALSAGAKDNGAPGYRDYWSGYYAAFVIDPDGHNIEAVFFDYDYNEAHS